MDIQSFLTFIGDNTIDESKNLKSSLHLIASPDLVLLFNNFDNVIPKNHSDPENVIQSKCYDMGKL